MKAKTTSTNETNIQSQASVILKTLLLLDNSYGLDYLIRILRGQDRYPFKKPEHAELETFGLLEEWYSVRIIKLVECLIKQGFIEVKEPRFGNLFATGAGQAYLQDPQAIWVDKEDLNEGTFERLLKGELRRLRREIGEAEEVAVYEIYTNHHVRAIASLLPRNMEELQNIPGLSQEQVINYGERILAAIKRVEDHPGEVAKEQRISRAFSEGHQAIKQMFLEEKSLEEIAALRNLSQSTIRTYLEHLHEAGEIDLRAWIENQVDPKILNKGVEYFRQVKNSRLTEAQEVLKIDFDTLRLCKFYVESGVAA